MRGAVKGKPTGGRLRYKGQPGIPGHEDLLELVERARARGWTLERQAAGIFGVSLRHLCRWLSGSRWPPRRIRVLVASTVEVTARGVRVELEKGGCI